MSILWSALRIVGDVALFTAMAVGLMTLGALCLTLVFHLHGRIAGRIFR